MCVNAVSFAVAWLNHVQDASSAGFSLTDLVNFAFAASGISCAEKMHKFNAANGIVYPDVQLAVDFYYRLSAEAATSCPYFAGTPRLLMNMHELGVLNFITSAIEQMVLDRWSAGDQSGSITPYLTEILGWRSSEFCKGAGHFAYVREHYDVQRIIYVADAVAEITSGFEHSQVFNVLPIGFSHLITREKVMHALALVTQAQLQIGHAHRIYPPDCLSIEPDLLVLPDQRQLDSSLKNAGAAHIVAGSGDEIMDRLSKLLTKEVLCEQKYF
jgi:hypothetical protein